MRSLLCLFVFIGLLVGLQRPVTAQTYEAGKEVPPGYHVVERRNDGALTAGTATLVGTWAITAAEGRILNSIDARQDGDLLYIPVVGPFVFMARYTGFHPLFALEGAMQAAGLGLLVYGATLPSVELVLVKDEIAIRAVAPMVVAGGGGLMLSGMF